MLPHNDATTPRKSEHTANTEEAKLAWLKAAIAEGAQSPITDRDVSALLRQKLNLRASNSK